MPRPIPRSCEAPVTSATLPPSLTRRAAFLAAQAFSNPSLPRRTTSAGSCFQSESSKSMSENDPSSEKISRSNQPATASGLERAEDRRQVDDPVAGQHPVEVVARLRPPVADVDARDDAIAVADGVLEHVVRVPEVVDVVEQLRRSARRSRRAARSCRGCRRSSTRFRRPCGAAARGRASARTRPAVFAARRRPSTMTRRASAGSAPSPGWPVRQRITSGSKGAKRWTAAHSASIRSAGSSGPGNGTG